MHVDDRAVPILSGRLRRHFRATSGKNRRQQRRKPSRHLCDMTRRPDVRNGSFEDVSGRTSAPKPGGAFFGCLPFGAPQ